MDYHKDKCQAMELGKRRRRREERVWTGKMEEVIELVVD